MGAVIADAFVNVRANTDGFRREATSGINATFGGIARTIGGLAAAVGVKRFFEGTVSEASALNESLNAVNVTFADLGEDAVARLHDIGESAATNMGLTQNEFNAAAIRFQAFSRSIAGASGRDVIDVMEDVTMRATDFASVMNVDVRDAQRLFQAGLAGETEPLRRYGIDISAAAVGNYALAEGIAGSYQELDESQKHMIRWALIADQTDHMAGDFARTSDELANSWRITTASFREASAVLGTGLLPGLKSALSGIREELPDITESFRGLGETMGENLTPVFEQIGPALGTAMESFVPIFERISLIIAAFAPLMEPVTAVLGAFGEIITTVLADMLVGFAPVIEVFAEFATGIANILGNSTVRAILIDLANLFAEVGSAIAEILGAALPIVLGLFRDLLPIIWPLVDAFTELFASMISTAGPILINILQQLAPIFLQIAQILTDALLDALPGIAEAFALVVTAVAPLIPLLATGLLAVLQTLEPILPQIAQGWVAYRAAAAAAQVVQAALNVVMLANPVMLIVVGLAALIAVLVTAYQRVDAFRNIVDAVGRFLRDLGMNVRDIAQAFVDWIQTTQAFRTYIEYIQRSLERVIAIGRELIDFFRNIFTGQWGAAWENVRNIFRLVLDQILDWLGTLGVLALQAIRAIGPLLLQAGRFIGEKIWEGIRALAGLVGQLLGNIPGWLGTAGATIVSWGRSLAEKIWEGIQKLGELTGTFIGNIPGWLGTAGTSIVNYGKTFANKIWDGIKTLADLAANFISQDLPGWLGAAGTSLLAYGANVVQKIWDGITFFGEAFLKNFVPRAVEWLAAKASEMVTFGGRIPSWIWEGMGRGAEIFSGIWDRIIQWFGDIGQKILDFGGDIAQALWDGFTGWLTDNPVSNFIAGWFSGDDQSTLTLASRHGQEAASNFESAFGETLRTGEPTQVTGIVEQWATWIGDAITSVSPDIAARWDATFRAAAADGVITQQEARMLMSIMAEAFGDGIEAELPDELVRGIKSSEGAAADAMSGIGAGMMDRLTRDLPKSESLLSRSLHNTVGDASKKALPIINKKTKGAGEEIIKGMESGRSGNERLLSSALGRMGAQIIRWLGNMQSLLRPAGFAVMTGFVAGINSALNLVRLVVTATNLVVRQIGAGVNLLAVGSSIMSRFGAGLNAGLSGIRNAVVFANNTLRALGSGINLFNAGVNVMASFERGLRAQWSRTQAFLRTVTRAIPALKGPPSVDRQLLTNSGELIMEGLNRGLERGFRDTQGLLQGFSSSIDVTGSSSGAASFGPGSVVVQFSGSAVPTASQARMVGEQVGVGISDALDRRRIRTLARTSSGGQGTT